MCSSDLVLHLDSKNLRCVLVPLELQKVFIGNHLPYHPKRWAQVSLQGYKDGDYAMTMGYLTV